MARPLIKEKGDPQGLVPRRGVLLFAWERRALKSLATANGVTMTEIIHSLIDNFMEEIETKGAVNVMYRYVGADLIDSEMKKKLQTQVFRCENDKFMNFTRYCLSIGDNPSMFLRKLVREYLGEPITEFTPQQLDKEIQGLR